MVLVIWQLETGHRDYMPRLGAPIEGITLSPDGILFALQCSDNAIRVINSRNRELETSVEGVRSSASMIRYRTF